MKKINLTIMEQKEVREFLVSFGLGEKEQVVYLLLLGKGLVTLSPLAQASGFPLTTVQSIVKRLVSLGLVGVTKQKTRQIYQAEDPAVLKKIFERKIEEAGSIIPLLHKLKTEPLLGARIRIFERERVVDIFHEALESKSKEIYEIVSAKDFQEIIGEKFHFTRRRVAKGIYLKSLRVEASEIKKYSKKIHERELREAKFLPAEMSFCGNIIFWGNSVAFFAAKDEGLAWVVESQSIREMTQQIFELLWSVSRRMETVVE